MPEQIRRAIPLGQAAAVADTREAAISPRMSNTIRLDIEPCADDLMATGAGRAQLSDESGEALSLGELQSLFENAYDATVVTDTDGTILFENVRAREFLHAVNGALTGENITSLISGADADTLRSVCDTLESERFIRISAWCHSSRGNYFPADIAVHRFAAGRTAHLCFFIRDITDRIRAEEAERNVERSRVMMESIGTVCHHLGQPATVLAGSLELLASLDDGTDAERTELIKLSTQASSRIGELLKELNELRTYRSEAYADDDSIVAIDGDSQVSAQATP